MLLYWPTAMAGVIKFGILRNFARACLVIRDAARITSILQYLHTSHVQLSSFVKMYFFNACYRRFVNNQVLFSSVQRHQIIFATKDFSRGEFFVLTVFWLICIWLTLIHSKFVNCPCWQFSIIVIFSSTDKIFISTVNMCKFNNVFIMTLFINKNNNYVLNFIRQKSVYVWSSVNFFLFLLFDLSLSATKGVRS